MSHKYDEHSTRNVVASVQALESMCLAVSVEHDVVFNLLEGLDRGEFVVGGELAFKVLRLRLVDLERRRGSGASYGCRLLKGSY